MKGITTTAYQAEDGKVFLNKEECEQYEKDNASIMMFNTVCDNLHYNVTTGDIDDDTDIQYIYLGDNAAVQKFVEAEESRHHSYSGIDEESPAGIYYFDYIEYEYLSIGDRINCEREKLDSLILQRDAIMNKVITNS